MLWNSTVALLKYQREHKVSVDSTSCKVEWFYHVLVIKLYRSFNLTWGRLNDIIFYCGNCKTFKYTETISNQKRWFGKKPKSQLCSSKNHKNVEQIKLNAEKNIKWYKKQSIIQSIDAISYSWCVKKFSNMRKIGWFFNNKSYKNGSKSCFESCSWSARYFS